jgi:hypothetical protein
LLVSGDGRLPVDDRKQHGKGHPGALDQGGELPHDNVTTCLGTWDRVVVHARPVCQHLEYVFQLRCGLVVDGQDHNEDAEVAFAGPP